MQTLSPTIISSFNSALSKLTGYARRKYAAELTITYFSGSARKAERSLCVSRAMVQLGLHEQRTGIRCLEAFSKRGRKKRGTIQETAF